MTDKFSIIPIEQLLKIILGQLEKHRRLFGIPKKLFFQSDPSDPFRMNRFGELLETPIGVAAGPHTQLAQNIVAAWLTGARFIELKTIQTLDELEISKPCIDMQDEGYNCEWSQELKIAQSYDQYLNAWILIHILKDKFNWENKNELGVIFNMSVGYDYAGILKENVQWFFEKMADSSEEIQEKIKTVKDIYPNIVNLSINPRISDNVTLSTMHGCPPDEIEKIGRYLIEEKRLHTTIKLNPTLIGKEDLRNILNNSGFETEVPDIAFEHDLKYDDAVKIIRNLQNTSKDNNVHFGLKLTNTLESLNYKDVFSSSEEMMYMSGRALHPVSVNLARKLQNDFDGKLDISLSGGVDAFNVSGVVACGLSPVTVCTDILKPGGYGRLNQYLEELKSAFSETDASSIDELIIAKSKKKDTNIRISVLDNLNTYADQTLQDKRYRKTGFQEINIKTHRQLGYFDCIHAPCIDTCPANQSIPDYMYHTANGDFEKAFDVIMRTNPFPNTTGMVCDHLCQTKCTRINYDSPVLIREIKRFIAEQTCKVSQAPQQTAKPCRSYSTVSSDPLHVDRPVRFRQPCVQYKNLAGLTIIGAGPSGLSCAYFLVSAGFEVDIYETKPKPGGMVSGAIPSFRLTNEAINIDIERIKSLGVRVHYQENIDSGKFEQIRSKSSYVYIATGAQSVTKLNIEGIEAYRVPDPLQFLFDVKKGKPTEIGKNVAIIGGGNTAMDTARTAYRLVGENGTVTILYRRTIKQMPADVNEIEAVMDEGIKIIELTDPIKINTENGKVKSLLCCKMKLGEKDNSGRPRPVKIPGSEFELEFDTIIPAIGQEPAIDFFDPDLLKSEPGDYETQIPNIFIGGDALRGASTAINAIGDGRKVAQKIIKKAGIEFNLEFQDTRELISLNQHLLNRTRKINPVAVKETALDDRKNFNLVTPTLNRDDAIKEASRCLLCDEVCNLCVTVCPNLALFSYQIEPVKYNLQKITVTNDTEEITDDQTFEVSQKYQILHIADWCNECGNCTTFCPSSGSPYKEKPHLYLNRKAFDANDEGYFLERSDGDIILYCKKNEQLVSLLDDSENFTFESDKFLIILNKETFEIIDLYILEEDNFEIRLQKAAEMSIIMQGANSLIY